MKNGRRFPSVGYEFGCSGWMDREAECMLPHWKCSTTWLLVQISRFLHIVNGVHIIGCNFEMTPHFFHCQIRVFCLKAQ